MKKTTEAKVRSMMLEIGDKAVEFEDLYLEAKNSELYFDLTIEQQKKALNLATQLTLIRKEIGEVFKVN